MSNTAHDSKALDRGAQLVPIAHAPEPGGVAADDVVIDDDDPVSALMKCALSSRCAI